MAGHPTLYTQTHICFKVTHTWLLIITRALLNMNTRVIQEPKELRRDRNNIMCVWEDSQQAAFIIVECVQEPSSTKVLAKKRQWDPTHTVYRTSYWMSHLCTFALFAMWPKTIAAVSLLCPPSELGCIFGMRWHAVSIPADDLWYSIINEPPQAERRRRETSAKRTCLQKAREESMPGCPLGASER